MDWLILIVSVPAIIVPVVLLFGFAGCGLQTTGIPSRGDGDGPNGSDFELPSAPQNLSAVAQSDSAVLLTWDNTEPAATSYWIERVPEGGDFLDPNQDFLVPGSQADPAVTTETDTTGLVEGATFIYQVRALVGPTPSKPSDPSSATVWPATPLSPVAVPVGLDEIDLFWSNASAAAVEFSLEHRPSGGVFSEIYRGTDTTFPHTGLTEGSQHDYRVFAIVVNGFEDSVKQEVRSAESAVGSATTFSPAFKPQPGTLTTDQPGMEGFCIVQRIAHTLLALPGTKVRIALRGSTTGSLTLDRVTISQVAASGDPYDSAPDLIYAATGVTLPANTPQTLGPVPYLLDLNKDLLIAFDISPTPGQGNLRYGPLAGADSYARAAPEAAVQDRTAGYTLASGNLYLIEQIEVLD